MEAGNIGLAYRITSWRSGSTIWQSGTGKHTLWQHRHMGDL